MTTATNAGPTAARIAWPHALLASVPVAYAMTLIDNSIAFTGVPSLRPLLP
jgi:hypothetical protein